MTAHRSQTGICSFPIIVYVDDDTSLLALYLQFFGAKAIDVCPANRLGLHSDQLSYLPKKFFNNIICRCCIFEESVPEVPL
jgi:hypothetical protein